MSTMTAASKPSGSAPSTRDTASIPPAEATSAMIGNGWGAAVSAVSLCTAKNASAKCLLRPRDYGQKDAWVNHIDDVWKQAAEARRRAADAIERGAALAEDHARRAEADGDHELAKHERAHAKHGQAVVAE